MSALANFDYAQSPMRSCWKLFYPLAFSMVLSSTIGIVDMYLAGLIGPAAQAAVGIGDQCIFAVIVAGTGLSCASSSLISRSAGAGERSMCTAAAVTSLLIAAATGILATLSAIFFCSPLMKMFQCGPDVESLAIPYTVWCSLANAPFIVVLTQSAIFRSLSRPDLALNVQLLTVGICHVLSILLFFSEFDISHSLKALAVAWVIASFIGAAAGVFYMWRDIVGASIDLSISLQHLRRASWELCCLALPAVIAESSLIAANFLLYAVSSALVDSASAQAALTVKLKIEETIALIPIMALGMAGSVVIGHHVGAGKDKLARESALTIAKLASLIMFGIGVFTSLFAKDIAICFSQDASTQAGIINYLFSSFLYFPACAFSTTMTNALEGAGSTRLPMYLNALILIGLRCSVSFICAISFDWGIKGIAFSLCLSQVLMAFASFVVLCFFFSRLKAPTNQFA